MHSKSGVHGLSFLLESVHADFLSRYPRYRDCYPISDFWKVVKR